MRPRLAVLLAALLVAGAAGVLALTGSAAIAPPSVVAPASPYALVNKCFVFSAADGHGMVKRTGDSFTADAAPVASIGLRLVPTALGRFLVLAPDKSFLAAGDGSATTAAAEPSDAAVWRISRAPRRAFTLATAADGRVLTVDPASRALVLAAKGTTGPRARFVLRRATPCAQMPNAQVDAHGRTARGASPMGRVQGTMDPHTHVTAFEFIGGDFHCGRPWHPFGVTFALPDCASIQGPQGSAAPVQNFLDYGEPVHPHDTVGWPTFKEWPGPTKLTEEGTYYTGLNRARLAGLRIMVTDLVDNEALCTVMPMKHNPCNDMDSVRLQARDLHALQNYIDAQSGGPGKGWLRIVTNPFEARRVANQGKLAIVEGIEVSRIFGCGEQNHVSQCDRADVDRGLAEVRKLGVSSFYPVHKFDNAFGGTKMDGGALGLVINGGNHLETNHFWDVQTCKGKAHDSPQLTPGDAAGAFTGPLAALQPAGGVPLYPKTPHCNAQGLTDLGRYLVGKMIDQHFVVEVDHMDVKTGDETLSILERRHYSGVISPHDWSSPEQYPRIFRLGGVITPIAGSSSESFVNQYKHIRSIRDRKFTFGFGYGSDMNGLADQPQPTSAKPIHYPFHSAIGNVTFDRERWGRRVFDLNRDGLSNYGMYADWMQELGQLGGHRMVKDMMNGAEAYLEMWERAYGVPRPGCRPANQRFSAAGLGGRHPVRLGGDARATLMRGGQPASRPGFTYRYCARGGTVVATFSRAGRVVRITSTAPGDTAGGIGPGASAARLAHAPRGAGGLRLGRRLAGGARYVYVVRGGRVKAAGVQRP